MNELIIWYICLWAWVLFAIIDYNQPLDNMSKQLGMKGKVGNGILLMIGVEVPEVATLSQQQQVTLVINRPHSSVLLPIFLL